MNEIVNEHLRAVTLARARVVELAVCRLLGVSADAPEREKTAALVALRDAGFDLHLRTWPDGRVNIRLERSQRMDEMIEDALATLGPLVQEAAAFREHIRAKARTRLLLRVRKTPKGWTCFSWYEDGVLMVETARGRRWARRLLDPAVDYDGERERAALSALDHEVRNG